MFILFKTLTYLGIFLCSYTDVRTYIHCMEIVYVHTYMRMYVRMYVHMYPCMYICMSVLMCVQYLLIQKT